MEKFYEVIQINSVGNGYQTYSAIVINPVIENGGIHATRVGKAYYYACDDDDRNLYHRCDPEDFFIVGNATCTERLDDPFCK